MSSLFAANHDAPSADERARAPAQHESMRPSDPHHRAQVPMHIERPTSLMRPRALSTAQSTTRGLIIT
eukprot:1779539-Alexandrium_andersonii.AAC.1